MSEAMFLIFVLVSIVIVSVKCEANGVVSTLEEVSNDYFIMF